MPSHLIPSTERSGLGLCLSGGGFRASLFHLGVLRRLAEVGLLHQVTDVSSVSGGSITAAQLAQTTPTWKDTPTFDPRAWETQVRDPLWQFCHRDIRTRPFLRSLLRPFSKGVAVRGIEANYQRHLTQQTLGDLPTHVRFSFCATDMIFATCWYFRRDTTGSHRAGYIKQWQTIPVAKAVAASSCFPPIFGPLALNYRASDFAGGSHKQESNHAELLKNICLTDGGLYDNLGLEPIWNRCRYAIVSDAGKISPYRADWSSIGTVKRYTTIMQEQINSLRMRWLIAKDRDPAQHFSVAYCSLEKSDKPDGYSATMVNDYIGKIRTDLDTFSRAECAILENHGYSLIDYYLKHDTFRSNAEALHAQLDTPLLAPNPEFLASENNYHKIRQALQYSNRASLFYRIRLPFGF